MRIVTRDDERQAAAADAFLANGAWVSHLAFAETFWVLRDAYSFDHRELARTIETLLADPRLVFEDRSTITAALEHYRAAPHLGFSDCLMLEIARASGQLPLATFDRKLARLPGAQLLA